MKIQKITYVPCVHDALSCMMFDVYKVETERDGKGFRIPLEILDMHRVNSTVATIGKKIKYSATIPYDELPLYINSEEVYTPFFTWRLQNRVEECDACDILF